MTNIFVDNACLGLKTLIAVTPDYYGTEKTRHDAPVGAKYTVVLPKHQYDRLTVKIPGAQQIDVPISGAEPTVEFVGLKVKPYVDGRTGQLAYSATADGIKAVGSDTGATGKSVPRT